VKIAVRVSPELHAALVRVAAKERRTVFNWVAIILETAVAAEATAR
jgi:predicted HicB family RNase H-like nuclease